MTQTAGDLWARLSRPLLDPETRFAWAAPVFRDLQLSVDGEPQALEGLFARVLYNDVEREVLCVSFGESPEDRSAWGVLVRLEREGARVRLEVALAGRRRKDLALAGRVLVGYPGAGDGPAATLQGPFAAVAVLHL
jgi:hypothetical protein